MNERRTLTHEWAALPLLLETQTGPKRSECVWEGGFSTRSLYPNQAPALGTSVTLHSCSNLVYVLNH